MSAQALHVTNGDSVLASWKKCALLGTHVAWQDALHEGPVPGDLPLEELSRVRADYLCARGLGNPIKVHRAFEKRDAIMRGAARFEEIVLWFEHDLYDQLQLLQALDVLRNQGLGAGRSQLIQSDQYLGMLVPDELLALYPKRKFITIGVEQAAARAWTAFTCGDPPALARAAKETSAGLPFLRDALRRLCEEFPAADSGLSRTQKQLLDACAQGARRKEDLFRLSQAREEAVFLGDSMCYAILSDLCAAPAPVIDESDSGYVVTLVGRRILAGDADWLEHQPLDRWIGGTHLRSSDHWRWDEEQETLVPRRTTVQARGGV